MVTRPAGHSLAEILVTLAFLGTALGAAASATILGARWTRDAGLGQEAFRIAGATLDSILARAEPPASGSAGAGALPLTVEWRVQVVGGAEEEAGAVVTVRVVARGRGAGPDTLAAIAGLWIRPPPRLEP